MKDKISIDRIQQLHPLVRDTFSNFITDCENEFEITLRIMLPVFRTIAEQDELYSHGRNGDSRPIVTNAKGGTSFHNFGLAVDLCEINKIGEVDWTYDNSTLVPIANKYGLEWGGGWIHMKDKPHFQIRTINGITYSENCSDLLSKVNNGEIDENGYINTF